MLIDFTRILHEKNPMRLELKNDPDAQQEYESEALSILSRFNEGALHMCDDETLCRQIATGMVRAAFEFWFSEEAPDVENTAFSLLQVYLDGMKEKP